MHALTTTDALYFYEAANALVDNERNPNLRPKF